MWRERIAWRFHIDVPKAVRLMSLKFCTFILPLSENRLSYTCEICCVSLGLHDHKLYFLSEIACELLHNIVCNIAFKSMPFRSLSKAPFCGDSMHFIEYSNKSFLNCWKNFTIVQAELIWYLLSDFDFELCIFICGFKHVLNKKKIVKRWRPYVRHSMANRGAGPSWQAKWVLPKYDVTA